MDPYTDPILLPAAFALCGSVLTLAGLWLARLWKHDGEGL